MPIYSMTGYGQSTIERDGRKLFIELKSVNHRFLDIDLRLPYLLNPYEDFVRKTLQKSLARGHVAVFIRYENRSLGAQTVMMNEPLLQAYLDTFHGIKKKYDIKNDIKMSDVIRINDIFSVAPVPEDEDVIKSLLQEALDQSISALKTMRANEGRRLSKDLQEKLSEMRTSLGIIEGKAPELVPEYRDKIRMKVAEYLESGTIDENRLSAEIAIYAERSCIDEEMVRLGSHFSHFLEILESEEPVGRKLDFIVQEMNREINTICSKSTNISITNTGLLLKNDIEKIREQIQNIE